MEVATIRERVQRRETAEASPRSRVADAEEALRVTRVSADTLGVDYAAALETAERERAEALQARDDPVARRLLDPLSEYVKLDPTTLGAGRRGTRARRFHRRLVSADFPNSIFG